MGSPAPRYEAPPCLRKKSRAVVLTQHQASARTLGCALRHKLVNGTCLQYSHQGIAPGSPPQPQAVTARHATEAGHRGPGLFAPPAIVNRPWRRRVKPQEASPIQGFSRSADQPARRWMPACVSRREFCHSQASPRRFRRLLGPYRRKPCLTRSGASNF